MNRFLSSLIGIALLTSVGSVAYAKPEYARAEKKPCNHCHVSASPGTFDSILKQVQPTTRNNRGMYYETHDHSLVGYIVKRLPQERLLAKFIWGEERDDHPQRIAVGDVKGDGKPRFITLHETPEGKGSILKVSRWDGKSYVTELEEKSESSPDKLQVGKYAGAAEPAVIVTDRTLWMWKGKTFIRKALSTPRILLGATTFRNKEERVLIAESPTDIRAYRVNSSVTGDWLVDGAAAPNASKDVQWLAMHGSQETLIQTGMDEQVADGGILGFWGAFQSDKPYIYYVKVDRDFDAKAEKGFDKDKTQKTITIKRENFYVVILNSKGMEVWASARLDMRPLDIIIDNARGDGKQGMMILLKEPAKGKLRQMGFYELSQEKEQ